MLLWLNAFIKKSRGIAEIDSIFSKSDGNFFISNSKYFSQRFRATLISCWFSFCEPPTSQLLLRVLCEV